MTHEDEDVEESKESDAINDKEDYQKDKERDRKKVKLEKSAVKDYLGEYSLKNSPGKSGKPRKWQIWRIKLQKRLPTM